jgi:hypothetical protein
MHRSKRHLYSITSSARASTVAGMSKPSARAVLRLMTSSYFVGACTGRSPVRDAYAADLRSASCEPLETSSYFPSTSTRNESTAAPGRSRRSSPSTAQL